MPNSAAARSNRIRFTVLKRGFLAARAFLMLLAGFIVGAWLIASFVTAPRVHQISPKLDWLAVHGDGFDTFFVGTSRVKQVVPSIVDEEFQKAGLKVRSFNLAADGMRPPEDGYVIDQMLQGRRAPLKYLVVEGNPISLWIPEEDLYVRRTLHWHDFKRMMQICHSVWAQTVTNARGFSHAFRQSRRNLGSAGNHLLHWGANATRMGRGSELLQGQLGVFAEENLSRWGVQKDGYLPPSPDLPMDEMETRSYLKSYKRLQEKGRRLDPMDAASQAHFARLSALARKHGGRLVIVSPPTTTRDVYVPRLPEAERSLFVDVSDHRRYSDLYETKVRLNGNHLNSEGCRLFTRLMAREFVAMLKVERK